MRKADTEHVGSWTSRNPVILYGLLHVLIFFYPQRQGKMMTIIRLV